MAKAKTIYSCTECGGQTPKWQGQCPHCMEWNTLIESVAEAVAPGAKNRFSALAASGKVQLLSEVEAAEVPRTPTGIEEFDREGRVLTLEFPDFYLVNTYFPNSGRDLERMAYKLKFNLALQHFVQRLHPGGVHSRGVKEKGVLIVGDFNVAHEEIDIARPKANRKNAGFTDEERGWMTQFLADGYLDAFRLFDQTGNNYTWWSYMHNAREKNIGWRIDLAVVSQNLKDTVISCQHLTEVYGSDHCPVLVEIE